MQNLIRTAVIILAIIGAAALLNPSAEKHRNKIKEDVEERSQLAAILRLGDLTAFVSNYHSLGFASYTTANEKILSVGAFGIVLVTERTK